MHGTLNFDFLGNEDREDLNFLIVISSRFINELNMKMTDLGSVLEFSYMDPDDNEHLIKMSFDCSRETINLDFEYCYDMDMFYKMIRIIAEETDSGLDYRSGETNPNDSTSNECEYEHEAAIDIDSE